MIELKSCPFCGGEAKHYTNTNFYEIVACKKCGSKTDYFTNKSAATKAWNRRAIDIVRCKDCVYSCDIESEWCKCENTGSGMRLDGYCSNGERLKKNEHRENN